MPILRELRSLTSVQRNTFIACFLGWSLDAFDFFLLTLCLRAIAADFHVGLEQAAEAIFWTLVMRPVGALLFGMMAEKYGRRPTLILNVVAFSFFELASAFSPSLGTFMVCRALFGIAMGGVWGVGAALALETLPAEGRGFFSGLLQEGYGVGNLLAAGLYALLFSHLHGVGWMTNWRVMFMIGSLPALLAFYMQFKVEESPAWLAAHRAGKAIEAAGGKRESRTKGLLAYLPSFLFLTLLMFMFMSFSHGSQDLYPAFLEKDHGLTSSRAGLIVVISNLGAITGGICCGLASERLGRKKTIVVAALLAIPMVPLWAWSHSMVLLAVGGFLMQFMVQGAWGVIPAHLNELAPAPVRAIFPGLAYQLGGLLSSKNAVIQAWFARSFSRGSLGVAMSGTVVIVATMVAIMTILGPEAKGVDMSGSEIN